MVAALARTSSGSGVPRTSAATASATSATGATASTATWAMALDGMPG